MSAQLRRPRRPEPRGSGGGGAQGGELGGEVDADAGGGRLEGGGAVEGQVAQDVPAIEARNKKLSTRIRGTQQEVVNKSVR